MSGLPHAILRGFFVYNTMESLEIWKDIPDYEGHYQVSNLGRVKSLKCRKEKILTPDLNKRGYLHIGLYGGLKRKLLTVHLLVASAFFGHKSNGTHEIVVDHINNIRTDNRLENLQLITHRENLSKDRKGTSKFTGVSWSKRENKWISRIGINKKLKHLGYFTCELEAAMAYQQALKELNI